MASAYAKVREQFGRPIAMFQAVKHHCANMLVGRRAGDRPPCGTPRGPATGGGEQFSYTAAIAATLRRCRPLTCNAKLNIQVHGGIGFTWEHDAHLYLRRATALAAIIDAEQAATRSPTWSAAACSAGGRSTCRPKPSRSARRRARRSSTELRDLDR